MYFSLKMFLSLMVRIDCCVAVACLEIRLLGGAVFHSIVALPLL